MNDENPFQGPQPYGAKDRERFLGREDLTRKLNDRILAHRCLTLFGPSGAGKSSLMQAGVIPHLEEELGFRTVRIDGWLPSDAPLERLAQALFEGLKLMPIAGEQEPYPKLELALELAEQQSDRPILVCLDQLEQLFFPGRAASQTEDLLSGLHALASSPMRRLHLVLSLREDYLGPLRDSARGRRDLWEQGFRVSPLTVGEMTEVACRLAAKGTPTQQWDRREVDELMLQVRGDGQGAWEGAEVQAAFAQIVCLALWKERARNGARGPVQAEPMFHQYLETTLEELGPLKARARTLLEERLIASDGSRALLMEKEALKALPGLSEENVREVLEHLEKAAVLQAKEHRRSRYFELGHDWLARKVFARRKERIERAKRLRWAFIASAAVGVALSMGVLVLWALRQRDAAERAQAHAQQEQQAAERAQARAEQQQQAAEQARIRARDYALMAGVHEMVDLGKSDAVARLLLEVKHPEQVRGWDQVALETLSSGMPLISLRCHGPISSATVSTDGQRVIKVCRDGIIQMWNANGTGMPEVLGKGESFTHGAVSPDGRYIFTVSKDNTARLWRTDRLEAPWVFPGIEGKVAEASFSADSRYVHTVVASLVNHSAFPHDHYTSWVWRIDGASGPQTAFKQEVGPREPSKVVVSPDGRRILITEGVFVWGTAWLVDMNGRSKPIALRWDVTDANFSPDGRRIVAATVGIDMAPNAVDPSMPDIVPKGFEVRVVNVDGSGAPRELRGHRDLVNSAVFSPDGQRVLTASQDETARVWNVNGSGETLVLEVPGHSIDSAIFSPDGKHILTISNDRAARVWSAESSSVLQVLRGHEEDIALAAFSSDGRRIITVSADVAKLWDMGKSRVPLILHGGEEEILEALTPDGQHIVTSSDDNTARVWNANGTGPPVVLRGHKDRVTSAAISPDGRRIVTASLDKTARVWNVDGTGAPVILQGHEDHVNSVVISPDGRRIVTTSEDTARVWNADGTGVPVVLQGHEDHVTLAVFSPDGRRIVTASLDKVARVWNADGTGPPMVLQGHEGRVTSAAFSPDGRRIVTASLDKTARVWNADGTGPPMVLRGHEGYVNSAAFSPDGHRIVTASKDKTARVWNADGTGVPVVLQGHEGDVNSAAFSPDGRRIVTASEDKTARVWNADGTGVPVVLQGHEGDVTSAAFSPEGRRIVTASTSDQTVRVWPFSIEELQSLLRDANRDCLSPEMRRIYLDENTDEAQERYEACERSYDRPPFFGVSLPHGEP